MTENKSMFKVKYPENRVNRNININQRKCSLPKEAEYWIDLLTLWCSHADSNIDDELLEKIESDLWNAVQILDSYWSELLKGAFFAGFLTFCKTKDVQKKWIKQSIQDIIIYRRESININGVSAEKYDDNQLDEYISSLNYYNIYDKKLKGFERLYAKIVKDESGISTYPFNLSILKEIECIKDKKKSKLINIEIKDSLDIHPWQLINP